jgi:alkylation response protein AidB-like acyl-CoA dehydrogenase
LPTLLLFEDVIMKTRAEITAIVTELSHKIAERAAQYDAEGNFAAENFEDIKASGYPSLSVPAEFGGWGAGLRDSVMAQEILGMGDGSTALAIAMHVWTIGWAAQAEKWPPELFRRLCEEVVANGALVNTCATEPELGSPAHGGRPTTNAYHDGTAWVINGRKSFASMAPILDYFVIPAAIQGTDSVGRFLVPRGPGITVEPNWDVIGMRSTGSNDITLQDVHVPDLFLIDQFVPQAPDRDKAVQNAWFVLTISAVYLGIATAAHQFALKFAQQRIPTALGKPIASLESIQRRLGKAEYKLQLARSILYYTAEQWDSSPEKREEMGDAIVVAKLTVSNHAIDIVNAAMRVVGGTSLSRKLPLERYYREVFAGLFHPLSDDSALPLLGRVALQRTDKG